MRKQERLKNSGVPGLKCASGEAKTVQDLLRHSKVQTTLDLYSQSITADRLAAQAQMLAAIYAPPNG